MWAIIGGKIFPYHILSSVAKESSVQEQHVKSKATWRNRLKPLTDNLSIHSQDFQYALVVAITATIGMLISQWFELDEGIWIVVTTNAILNRNYYETSWAIWKVVHRIIGTIIGAVIALIIIDNTQDIWMLSLLLFIFMTVYLIFMRIEDYAFTVVFMTTFILLLIDIVNQGTGPLTPLERIENIFIGCVFCLIASIIWRASSLRKSSSMLGNKTE